MCVDLLAVMATLHLLQQQMRSIGQQTLLLQLSYGSL
jgi:hypothetical protein